MDQPAHSHSQERKGKKYWIVGNALQCFVPHDLLLPVPVNNNLRNL